MINYGNLIDTSSCHLKAIAIPLLIDYNDVEDHANMLIIDPTTKTCEHFEPHGANLDTSRHSEKINSEIERVARKLCEELFPDYKYIPRNAATNFQSILNDRFVIDLKYGIRITKNRFDTFTTKTKTFHRRI